MRLFLGKKDCMHIDSEPCCSGGAGAGQLRVPSRERGRGGRHGGGRDRGVKVIQSHFMISLLLRNRLCLHIEGPKG